MDQFQIRIALPQDLLWINQRYDEINFAHTKTDDLAVIASLNGKEVGLGRLVRINEFTAELGGIYVFPEFRKKGIADKIVQHLLEKSPYAELFCLPFDYLKSFYLKFGFNALPSNEVESIPQALSEKLAWCRQTFPELVIVLKR